MSIDALMSLLEQAKSKGFNFHCSRTGSADAKFAVWFLERGTLKVDGRIRVDVEGFNLVETVDKALRKLDALILERPNFRDRPDRDFSIEMQGRRGKHDARRTAWLADGKKYGFRQVFE